MNIFKKLFSIKSKHVQENNWVDKSSPTTADMEIFQKLIEEILAYFNAESCQCAFPRFRQYTSIDCSEYHKSFFMSETESLIHQSKKYFHIQEKNSGQEVYQAIYTCKKCGSTYDWGWSDFSIYVSRSYLKPKEVKVIQVGEDIEEPIPFAVGLSGHSLPDASLFKKVSLEEFRSYIQAKKDDSSCRKLH